MNRFYFAIFLWLSISTYCVGHSGGLDRNGGHNSSSGYHFHGGGSSDSSGLFGAPDASTLAAELAMERRAANQAQIRVLGERTAARETARASARTAARSQGKAAETSQSAKYSFHHSKQEPYLVADFTDGDDKWECMLAKGFKVNLKKDVIVRIEPIENPSDFRTWRDSAGKYSIVARYQAFSDPEVELLDLKSKVIKFNVHILSSYDQQHLYHKILHPATVD